MRKTIPSKVSSDLVSLARKWISLSRKETRTKEARLGLSKSVIEKMKRVGVTEIPTDPRYALQLIISKRRRVTKEGLAKLLGREQAGRIWEEIPERTLEYLAIKRRA